MEQALNQFTGGMQLDTHPMVQGNNTLTNCMNGTLITMNGNEVVLQNDMGNRKVDNAYLPSGYEPVGIKEYGGIIYVASYNPITNRSQIGSFPSPEIKINNNDDEDLKFVLKDKLIDEFSTKTETEITFLESDTVVKQLNTSTSLHVGDKFTVYGDLGDSEISKISNYNNTTGNKITTPKNKQFTLSLGILNSQNEFNDITSSLERWDEDSKIIDESGKSDLYKFNDGYFIPKIKNLDNNTLADNNLLAERSKIAANTYAYKLVGPLVLKIKLNHIEQADYNIRAYRFNDGNEKIKLIVTSNITYNCPDGISSTSSGNEIYSTFEEGLISIDVFDFYKYNDSVEELINGNPIYIPSQNSTSKSSAKKAPSITTPIVAQITNPTVSYDYLSRATKDFWTQMFPTGSNFRKVTYNPITNLYTAEIKKEYELSQTSGNFNYYFCIRGINDQINDKYLYLRNLSKRGSINLDLIGTNHAELIGWTFYTKDNNTIINSHIQIYKEADDIKFKNLTAVFKSDENDEINEVLSDELSDEISYKINFSSGAKYKPRHVYQLVKLYYDVYEGNSENQIYKETKEITVPDNLFFITTTLFNKDSTSNIISDYIHINTEDKENFQKKLNINVKSTGKISYGSETITNKGSLQSKTQVIDYYEYHSVPFTITPEITIDNENLYPELVCDQLKEIYSHKENYNIENYLSNTDQVEIVSNVLIFYQKFHTTNVKCPKIKNLFVDVKDVLYDIFSYTKEKKLWCTMAPDYTSLSGNSDIHYVMGAFCNTTDTFTKSFAGGSKDYNEKWIDFIDHKAAYDKIEATYRALSYDRKDGEIEFESSETKESTKNDTRDLKNNLTKFFDEKITDVKCQFTWGFGIVDEFKYINSYHPSDSFSNKQNTILFVKLYDKDSQTSYRWVPFGLTLLSRKAVDNKSEFDNTIYDMMFAKNYVYAAYSDIDIEGDVYYPNIIDSINNYVKEYDFTHHFVINLNKDKINNITQNILKFNITVSEYISSKERYFVTKNNFKSEITSTEANDIDYAYKNSNGELITKDRFGEQLDPKFFYHTITPDKLIKVTKFNRTQLIPANIDQVDSTITINNKTIRLFKFAECSDNSCQYTYDNNFKTKTSSIGRTILHYADSIKVQ